MKEKWTSRISGTTNNLHDITYEESIFVSVGGII